MGSHGIKDRVAIVGMGCTPFGEHWDKGTDDLLIDASNEAFASAGIDKDDVDAYWLGTAQVGHERHHARPPAAARRQAGHPRRELLRDRLRGAAPGRVRGRVRRVRRRDGDRRREGEGQRLPGPQRVPDPDRRHRPHAHRGGDVLRWSRPAYAQEVRRRRRRAARGARPHRVEEPLQRRPQPARAVPQGDVRSRRSATRRRWPATLGVFDCAGVADGSAAAIVVRAEDAHRYTDKPLYVKALSFVAGNGSGLTDPDYDYTHFPEIAARGRDAYAQAGITDPRHELAMAEVHDCFTPTELVLMEDLGFAERGTAWKDVLAGTFDLDGELPVNPDGGLKSFGHPVGASGLRMMFEAWLQLRGEAPEERTDRARPTAASRSPTTSAATPARWCRSSRSSGR